MSDTREKIQTNVVEAVATDSVQHSGRQEAPAKGIRGFISGAAASVLLSAAACQPIVQPATSQEELYRRQFLAMNNFKGAEPAQKDTEAEIIRRSLENEIVFTIGKELTRMSQIWERISNTYDQNPAEAKRAGIENTVNNFRYTIRKSIRLINRLKFSPEKNRLMNIAELLLRRSETFLAAMDLGN